MDTRTGCSIDVVETPKWTVPSNDFDIPGRITCAPEIDLISGNAVVGYGGAEAQFHFLVYVAGLIDAVNYRLRRTRCQRRGLKWFAHWSNRDRQCPRWSSCLLQKWGSRREENEWCSSFVSHERPPPNASSLPAGCSGRWQAWLPIERKSGRISNRRIPSANSASYGSVHCRVFLTPRTRGLRLASEIAVSIGRTNRVVKSGSRIGQLFFSPTKDVLRPRKE